MPCDEGELNSPDLLDLYEDAKETLLNHTKSKHIRDDYAELTDLCLKFFGIRNLHNNFIYRREIPQQSTQPND